jgi:hypothetical protein
MQGMIMRGPAGSGSCIPTDDLRRRANAAMAAIRYTWHAARVGGNAFGFFVISEACGAS